MTVTNEIVFDEEMRRRAETRAAELGLSFADYVRSLVPSDLSRRPVAAKSTKPKPDISVFFDLGASEEPTDIARDKDNLVGEAVWREYLRRADSRADDDVSSLPDDGQP